jgi:hypothetical protein
MWPVYLLVHRPGERTIPYQPKKKTWDPQKRRNEPKFSVSERNITDCRKQKPKTAGCEHPAEEAEARNRQEYWNFQKNDNLQITIILFANCIEALIC